MTTPIFDFLKSYIKSDFTRFHMPGHKGVLPDENPLKAVSEFDLTEINNADELFAPTGIIAQSEENTASIYNSGTTSFSTSGSTPCIKAMLHLVASEGNLIIAGRNVHASFIHGCALLGINVSFIETNFASSDLVSTTVTPQQVKAAIEQNKSAKAVYITSPDYMGCMSDIAGISEVCRKANIPLVVDNAHGAHLSQDLHPITNGATLCCDSAHKTLPVLTGGSYLHTAKQCAFTKVQVKSAMALFSSTSPSYLTLMSLDLNNNYLHNKKENDFNKLACTVNEIHKIMREIGFKPISNSMDITKITLDANSIGIDGKALKIHLNAHKIEPEYTSDRYAVLMLSPQNSECDINRLTDALQTLIPKTAITNESFQFASPKVATTIRRAILGNSKVVAVDDALGLISAESKIKCPPGVPIIIPGEIIDKKTQEFLKKSSIFQLSVLE